jgi:hypothetical protein
MPQLRDRPTSRNRPAAGVERGQQILANIAELIPLAEHGSLLRAIAHNQAQTSVLGINQLTTGLFRALEYYSQKTFTEADSDSIIVDRILPNLPVYEILQNLRIYQDIQGKYIQLIEPAFPAGNTAFVALREDIDAMQKYLPLLQQELIRRHGLNVGDFLENGTFIQALLPTLRPDLAVLLQNNLFNTSTDQLTANFTNNLETGWIEKVQSLLNLPIQIQYWRSIIWDLIGESIFARVQSFTELASALYRFSSTGSPPVQQAMTHLPKLSSQLNEFIRSAPVEDEMRQFLVGAVNYLNSFSEGSVEVPVTIIRALNDVNRLAIIEENPLSPEKNQALRFAGLQIARLSGDNG